MWCVLTDIGFKKTKQIQWTIKMTWWSSNMCLAVFIYESSYIIYKIQCIKGREKHLLYIFNRLTYIFLQMPNWQSRNMIKLRYLTRSLVLISRCVFHATTYQQRGARKRYDFNQIDNYDVRFIEIIFVNIPRDWNDILFISTICWQNQSNKKYNDIMLSTEITE